ncbi:MAG: carbohydrate porin [Aeromonadales bacterium]|nr:carbohydrate porin [Aeromonadales bacterium]
MKKVNLLAAAVLAASMSAPAFADYTPNAYFNGYMRAGVGFDKNGHTNGSDDVAHKVGRLGSESRLYGEIGLGADVAKVDDTVWTVNTMLAVSTDEEGSWVGNNALAFRQFNVEVKGLFDADKDAKVWVGKKYVQRQDIHIIDTYYYDISGNGAGIENVSLGAGKFSTAFVQNTDQNNIFDVRYNFPLWDGASFQVGNAYVQQKKQKESDNQLNGNTVTLEFSQGFNGGWNKTVFQWFKGASAAAAQVQGWNHNDEEDGNAYKLWNFGETTIVGDLKMFHAVDYAYQKLDGIDGNTKKVKTFHAVVRPWYKLTKMTRLYVELGAYGQYTKYDDGDKEHDRMQKATLAYAVTPDAGNFWSRPEIRVYTTWLHGTDKDAVFSAGYRKGSTDITVGVQAEAWW